MSVWPCRRPFRRLPVLAWMLVGLIGLRLMPAARAEDCRLDKTPGERAAPVVSTLRDGPLVLVWTARPWPPTADRHVALDLRICGASVTRLRVDADMPAHRHGMNYAASVEDRGGGRFRAQGLLFHMPGRWRLIVDVDADGESRRLTQLFDVR